MTHLKILVNPLIFFSLIFILSLNEIFGQQYEMKQDTLSSEILKEDTISDSITHKLKQRINNKQIKRKMEMANAYWHISQNYEDIGILDSAIKYVEKGWDIAKKNNYNRYFDQYLPFTAYCYWLKGNYSRALSFLMEAERNIEHADSNRLKVIDNVFGLTYTQLGNYELGEKYYLKALEISEKLGSKSYSGTVYANLGKLYYKQGKFQKALNFYHKGSKIEIESGKNREAGRSFASMANIHLDKNQPDKAEELLNKARKHNKIADDNIGLCRSYVGFGNLHLYKNNISKAGYYFHKAENLAQEKGTEKELMLSYKGLYKTYYKAEKYNKAFDFLKKHQELYKKSYNVNEIIKAEKIQHELNMQNEINKRQENQIKNQKTTNRLLIIILTLIVILAVILTVMFIRGRKIRKHLQKKNIEIHTQKDELQKLNEELKTAKAKTEESEQLKDQFLRNMSHEIRTPLNGIMGFSSIIAENTTQQSDRIKYHQMIEKNAKTLLNTIDDILDIAKIKTQQIQVIKENVNINSLLLELKKMFFFDKSYQNNGNLKLYADTEESYELIIHTDPYKLRRILLALIENSLKFTDEGKIIFGYRKQKDYIQFFVTDTGIGIYQNQKENIFNSFIQGEGGLTRNYGGIGLGLAIAKSFVEILGGKIWFDSEINKGTTFYFTVPMN
mgnify:CR=1 FL=1